MYITSLKIENIKSIQSFSMDFPDHPAGWHVIIGDNGAGKSGLIQAIAACLCGPERYKSFRYSESRMLRKEAEKGIISLNLTFETFIDVLEAYNTPSFDGRFALEVELLREGESVKIEAVEGVKSPVWNTTRRYFSASFGPFRRMAGGVSQSNKLFDEDQRAAAHISVFDTEVAFVKVDEWLKDLKFKELEKKQTQGFSDDIVRFLNQEGLLPNGFRVGAISSEGVFIQSPEGLRVPFVWLSDGYRSILSLMLELIRQMRTVFFIQKEFEYFFEEDEKTGKLTVSFPGVVLIDEIDAHLHPTWQTRIGDWFTTYFPRIQFIVTTHSPLICRAAEKGTVWRLAAPGSGESSGQVTGTAFERLVYGNVLDAYGTEAFGENVTSSAHSTEMRETLAELNLKSFKGTITEQEEEELHKLQSILPTGN